jgi:hypothetical protein
MPTKTKTETKTETKPKTKPKTTRRSKARMFKLDRCPRLMDRDGLTAARQIATVRVGPNTNNLQARHPHFIKSPPINQSKGSIQIE